MNLIISLVPLLITLPLILLFTLGVPIIIAVFVYRDAKKRDTNALLWALVSAFAPSFIGLIIYLIVRNDFKLKEFQYSGETASQAEYVHVNPESNCESSCETNSSSYTSDEKPSETKSAPATKHNKIPTWGKVLIVLGIALVVISLISICIMIYQFFNYSYLPNVNNFNDWSYIN